MTILTIDVALSQLGIREATGNNDGIPAERYCRGDEVMWCACFLMWCNKHSDDALIEVNDKVFWACRAVAGLEAEFKKRGWWLPPTTPPVRNDIAFYNWAARDVGKTGRHTDIIDDVVGNKLHTVGGNQANAVTRAVRTFGSPQITGFGRMPLRAA